MHELRPMPPWVWRYKQKYAQITNLFERLQHMGPTSIHDLSGRMIEMHQMDFASGATNISIAKYFKPNKHTKLTVANSTLDPADDKFMLKRHTSKKKHLLYQSFSKYLRNSPKGNKAPYPWQETKMDKKNASLFSSDKKHGFTIEKGAACNDPKNSHQLVIMKSNRLASESKPSVGELLVLTKWMMNGLKSQKKYLKPRGRLEHLGLFALDYPTMVISFLPNRVRILYGYFEEGRLKLAYTPAINFEENYTTKMDILLQWAWPQVSLDTTKPPPLPTIEDDEEDEWSEWDSLMEESTDSEESEADWEWETGQECEGESDTDWETDEEEERK